MPSETLGMVAACKIFAPNFNRPQSDNELETFHFVILPQPLTVKLEPINSFLPGSFCPHGKHTGIISD